MPRNKVIQHVASLPEDAPAGTMVTLRKEVTGDWTAVLVLPDEVQPADLGSGAPLARLDSSQLKAAAAGKVLDVIELLYDKAAELGGYTS